MNIIRSIKDYDIYSKKEDQILTENYYGYNRKNGKDVYVKTISNKKAPVGSLIGKQLNDEIIAHEQLYKKNAKNVMLLIDVAYTQNNIYLIYQNNKYETLKSYLNYKKMIQEKECINYFIQIYFGYCESYYMKVKYRDITLNNILIGEEDTIRVDDFGLFKTLFYQKNSTLEYRVNEAPETQKDRKSYTYEKSDSWSLGIILFQMLFQNEPAFQLGQLIIPPSRIITGQMAQLLYALLQIDPAKRISWGQILSHDCIKNYILNQKQKQDWNLQLSTYLSPSSVSLAERYPQLALNTNLQGFNTNLQDQNAFKQTQQQQYPVIKGQNSIQQQYPTLTSINCGDSLNTSKQTLSNQDNQKQMVKYPTLAASPMFNQSAQFKQPIDHMMPGQDNYNGDCLAANFDQFLITANESILRQSIISSQRNPQQQSNQTQQNNTQNQQNYNQNDQKYPQMQKQNLASANQNAPQSDDINSSQQRYPQFATNLNNNRNQLQNNQQYDQQQQNKYQQYQQNPQQNMNNSVQQNNYNMQGMQQNQYQQQPQAAAQQQNNQNQQNRYPAINVNNTNINASQKYPQNLNQNNNNYSQQMQQDKNQIQNQQQQNQIKQQNQFQQQNYQLNQNNQNFDQNKQLQYPQVNQQQTQQNQQQPQTNFKNSQVQYQDSTSLNSISTNQSQDWSFVRNQNEQQKQQTQLIGVDDDIDDFNLIQDMGNTVQDHNQSVFLQKKKQKIDFISRQKKNSLKQNITPPTKKVEEVQKNVEEQKKNELIEQQILKENLKLSMINQNKLPQQQQNVVEQMDVSKKIPAQANPNQAVNNQSNQQNEQKPQINQNYQEPIMQVSRLRGENDSQQDEFRNLINDKQIYDRNVKILQEELVKYNVLAETVERAEDVLQAKSNFWVVVSFFILKKLYLVRKELEEQLDAYVKVDESLERWEEFCLSPEYAKFMEKLRRQNEMILNSVTSLQKITIKRLQRLNPQVSNELKKHVPIEETPNYSANLYVHLHFHIISLQEALSKQMKEAQMELLRHIIQLQDCLLIVEQGLFVNNEDFFSIQQYNSIQMTPNYESLQIYSNYKQEKLQMFLMYYRSMGYNI